MKILTIGGATQDITFHSKEGVLVNNPKDLTRQKLVGFELAAKLNIQQAEFSFGGGAVNSAVNFSNLGNNVTSCICVGNDFIGQEILKNLKTHKIKTDLVQQEKNSSGLSFVINAKNLAEEHVLFTYRGANEDLKIEVDKISGQSAKSKFDLIYLTSLSGKNTKSNLANIFRYKNKYKKDVKLAWNPGNLQIKSGLNSLKPYLKHTDIFIINKDEAIELCLNNFKGNKTMLNNPRELLRILSEYCQGTIVVTDGRNGAYALWPRTNADGTRIPIGTDKKIYFESSCKIKVADTTGVGDAFGSTFVWSLISSDDIQKSLSLAIKNACSVLKTVGAQRGLLNKTKLLN